MRSTRLALPLLFLLHSGCLRETGRESDTAAAAEEVATEPAQASPELREVVVHHRAEDESEAAEAVPPDGAPPPAPAPRHVSPEAVFFHLGAGYGALGLVDLAPCRDQGLPRGYLRMHVTFLGSGRVARAAVESPVAPPAEALTCIGEQLEVALVPEFGGGEVTLSKSFFVN